MTNPSPPFRPTPDAITRNIGRRMRRVELGDVGLWHYVVDPSPPVGANKWSIPTTGTNLPTGGSIPPDAMAMNTGTGDVDTVFFQNGWRNAVTPDGTYVPLAFRMHPPTHIELVGAVTGGPWGVPLATLPVWARPRFTIVSSALLSDGSGQWVTRISALDGTITILNNI